jgi:thiol-disulfide isomerase/thioredoxin
MRISLFFIALIFTQSIKSQTCIYGKISNFSGKLSMQYFSPINGFFNFFINPKTINISEDGSYFINENGISKVICISLNDLPIYIPLSGKDTVHIDISFNEFSKDGDSGIWFYGSNKAGLEILNRFYAKPFQKFEAIRELHSSIKNIGTENVFEQLMGILKKQTRKFDSLLHSKQISQSFHSIAIASINSNLLTEFLNPFSYGSDISLYFSNAEKLTLQKKIFQFLNPYEASVSNAIFGFYYIDSYIRCSKDKNNLLSSVKVVEPNKLAVHADLKIYNNIENIHIQENMWGIQFSWLKKLFPDEFDKRDLNAFEKAFPQSKYLHVIREMYSETESRLTDSLMATIKWIDTLGKIKVLKELTGQIYFVDLWATWCLPCIQEFNYNGKIDSFLSKNKINKLYISIDDIGAKGKWKNYIGRYRLNGAHILASQQIINDIKNQVFGNNEIFSIPRYFMISNSGSIIHNNLTRPSDASFFVEILKIINTTTGK